MPNKFWPKLKLHKNTFLCPFSAITKMEDKIGGPLLHNAINEKYENDFRPIYTQNLQNEKERFPWQCRQAKSKTRVLVKAKTHSNKELTT